MTKWTSKREIKEIICERLKLTGLKLTCPLMPYTNGRQKGQFNKIKRIFWQHHNISFTSQRENISNTNIRFSKEPLSFDFNFFFRCFTIVSTNLSINKIPYEIQLMRLRELEISYMTIEDYSRVTRNLWKKRMIENSTYKSILIFIPHR